jgi:hypothetical protein
MLLQSTPRVGNSFGFAGHVRDKLGQWFANFFGERTTQKNLVVREGQNIDLYRDSRTTSANLAEQTLGITELGICGLYMSM